MDVAAILAFDETARDFLCRAVQPPILAGLPLFNAEPVRAGERTARTFRPSRLCMRCHRSWILTRRAHRPSIERRERGGAVLRRCVGEDEPADPVRGPDARRRSRRRWGLLDVPLQAPRGAGTPRWPRKRTRRAGPGRLLFRRRWQVRPHSAAAMPRSGLLGAPRALRGGALALLAGESSHCARCARSTVPAPLPDASRFALPADTLLFPPGSRIRGLQRAPGRARGRDPRRPPSPGLGGQRELLLDHREGVAAYESLRAHGSGGRAPGAGRSGAWHGKTRQGRRPPRDLHGRPHAAPGSLRKRFLGLPPRAAGPLAGLRHPQGAHPTRAHAQVRWCGV